jgi:hypothetical protein
VRGDGVGEADRVEPLVRLHALQERGIDAVTVAGIAAATGVSRQLLLSTSRTGPGC